MKTNAELKRYFLHLVKLLDNHELFADISLSAKTMTNAKKSSYWSTVYFRGVRRNKYKLGYATIYINIRDINNYDTIRLAVAHEAAHLISTKEDILQLLKSLENTNNPLGLGL